MVRMLILIAVLAGLAFARPGEERDVALPESAAGLVPAKFVLFEVIRGDLNKDGEEDLVLIIKGTDRRRFVKDEYRGLLDRNRRGIVIAFKNGDTYERVMENRTCFSSEQEDGGIYFPPALCVYIKNGNLFLHYAHGRYGSETYNFRYQNSDFELIGYDNTSQSGPTFRNGVSLNFMTKKMLTKKNINFPKDDEIIKESWQNFTIKKLIQLRKVADFDELNPLEIINKQDPAAEDKNNLNR